MRGPTLMDTQRSMASKLAAAYVGWGQLRQLLQAGRGMVRGNCFAEVGQLFASVLLSANERSKPPPAG
jgi:hypothetical protein